MTMSGSYHQRSAEIKMQMEKRKTKGAEHKGDEAGRKAESKKTPREGVWWQSKVCEN